MKNYITILLLLTLGLMTFAQQPGTIDETFGNSGKVMTDIYKSYNDAQAVIIQPDGKILAGGYTNGLGVQQYCTLVRYQSEGTYDASFGSGGVFTFNFGTEVSQVFDIALQADGKILICGYSNSGDADISVARVLPDGGLDNTFGVSGISTIDLGGNEIATCITVQEDGKIVIAGQTDISIGSDLDLFVCRFLPNGTLDNGFSTNGFIVLDLASGSYDMPGDVAMHQGKILVSSYAYQTYGSTYDAIALVRLKLDGTLDPGFGINGISINDGHILCNMVLSPGTSLSIDSQYRIVVASRVFGLESIDFALFRYLNYGYPDNSFGENGVVITDMIGDNAAYSVVHQPDGKILAGGYHSNTSNMDFCLARYLEDGSLDADFGTHFGVSFYDISQGGSMNDAIQSLAIQENGKILAAGGAYNAAGDQDFVIVRFYSGLPTGLSENNYDQDAFGIQPNPCNGEFSIQTDLSREDIRAFRIYDLSGRIVFEEQGFPVGTYNLNFLEEGMYLAGLVLTNDVVYRKLIIHRD
ncbi:MAG: T9SS type A sorting domain-containing protein [Bacteroidetes bacterium]|nr:T9SS type A sorting domain-containing protein [Bacteroidota bacterium]